MSSERNRTYFVFWGGSSGFACWLCGLHKHKDVRVCPALLLMREGKLSASKSLDNTAKHNTYTQIYLGWFCGSDCRLISGICFTSCFLRLCWSWKCVLWVFLHHMDYASTFHGRPISLTPSNSKYGFAVAFLTLFNDHTGATWNILHRLVLMSFLLQWTESISAWLIFLFEFVLTAALRFNSELSGVRTIFTLKICSAEKNKIYERERISDVKDTVVSRLTLCKVWPVNDQLV